MNIFNEEELNKACIVLRAIDPLFTPEVETSFRKIFGVSTARANDIARRRLNMVSYTVPKSEIMDDKPEEIDYKVTFEGAERYTLPALKKEMQDFIVERLRYYKDNFKDLEKRYWDLVEKYELSLPRSADIALYQEYVSDVKLISKTGDLRSIPDIIQRANAYERKYIQPTLSGKDLKDFKDTKSVVKYVALKVRGEALGRILGRRRVECHVDMIRNAKLENFVLDALKKTLIFTSYVDVVKGITDYFSSSELKKHFTPIPVYQETSKNLPRIIKDFYEKPAINPLVATYSTLSTAVPITAASTVILFNQPFRSWERDQAISRAYRYGQDGIVTVVNVILDTGEVPNISTRSEEIMKWSQEQVEQITGVRVGDNDSSVGLEEFIDHEELSFMSTDAVTKTVDEYHADIMALTASTEEFTEAVFTDDVVPSLEGIFDTAIDKVKSVFRTFSTKAIDKERVVPFKPSSEFNGILAENYATLADLYVMRPEGLSSTYIDYAVELQNQFASMAVFFETALRPINQFLATLAGKPENIGSIRPGEFNLYLKTYDLAKQRAKYAAHFDSSATATAQYHQMIKRNEDWRVLGIKLQDVQVNYLKISPEKVEASVNTAYEILEDLVRRLKSDEELRKLSKVQIRDLSTLAFSVASVVEYYSVLMFSWRVFNQSLRETEKNILSAKARGFKSE